MLKMNTKKRLKTQKSTFYLTMTATPPRSLKTDRRQEALQTTTEGIKWPKAVVLLATIGMNATQ